MSAARKATREQARRFLRRAHFLDAKAPDIDTVLSHHGYIQIDPINVCGRMHDLILRNRVAGYREGGLTRHLHGEAEGPGLVAAARTAFEHHVPGTAILVAFPSKRGPTSMPPCRPAPRSRVPGRDGLHRCARRSSREGSWSGLRQRAALARRRSMTSARGVASGEPRLWRRRHCRNSSSTGASSFRDAGTTAGSTTCRNASFRPPHLAERGKSSPDEIARWLALTRLRQHRLVALKRAEAGLVEDVAERIAIDGCPPLHCLKADLHLLDDTGHAPDAEPLLLAPLDPMIYDRRVTLGLWDFDYTWEVYTPPARRRRGYYALPVLSGTELVGHVDPKANRERGTLDVVSKKVRRGHAVTAPTGALARFLGLKYR